MSINRVGQEDVVHIYNGILLSHEKERTNAIWSSMDATRDYHTDVSEREQQIPYDPAIPLLSSLSLSKSLSCVRLFVTSWTIAHLAPLSMGILQEGILEWVAMPPPGDLPNPGIKPRSSALQADSLPCEPWGKPKNTGVGSLSRFQWIFLSQDLNWGLWHCRQILYQLSYHGSYDHTNSQTDEINANNLKNNYFKAPPCLLA